MFKNTKNIVLFSLFSFFTSTIAQLAPEKNATHTVKGEMSKKSWLGKLINADVLCTLNDTMEFAASKKGESKLIFRSIVKQQTVYNDATVEAMLNTQFSFTPEANDPKILITGIIQRTLKEYAIGFIFWGNFPYKDSDSGKALFNQISIIPAKCFAENSLLIRKSFGGYILKQYHYDEQLVEGLATIIIDIYGTTSVYLRVAHMLETQEATLKRRVISGDLRTNLEDTILNMAMYYSVCDSKYILCQIGARSKENSTRYRGAIKISNLDYSGRVELEAIQNSPNSMSSELNVSIARKIRNWIKVELGASILLNTPEISNVKLKISLDL